jgi:hypothetical protein
MPAVRVGTGAARRPAVGVADCRLERPAIPGDMVRGFALLEDACGDCVSGARSTSAVGAAWEAGDEAGMFTTAMVLCMNFDHAS